MITAIHAADLHLGAPFSSFDLRRADALKRRQRQAFAGLIEYCLKVKANLLLLSGDIFDCPRPSDDTAALFGREISRLENTRVFAALGNHDCGAADAFPKRVHVFPAGAEKLFLPELNLNVWGQSFSRENSPALMGGLRAEDGKTNILCVHGNVGGADYNPISPSELAESGFDYIALGHKHDFSVKKYGSCTVCYSGCLMGRGFDETGEKGFARVQIDGGSVKCAFIPSGAPVFKELTLFTEDFGSEADLISRAAADLSEDDLCRVEICGGSFSEKYIEEGLNEKAFYAEVTRSQGALPQGMIFRLLEQELRDEPRALDMALKALMGRGDLI